MNRIHLGGKIEDTQLDIKAEDMKGIKKEMILKLYKSELDKNMSKRSAAMNTAVMLGISENTVWRTVNEQQDNKPKSL